MFVDKIAFKLIEILQKKFPNVDLTDLDLNSDIKVLGIDSLDFVELIYDVETQFDIEIPSESLLEITTVESLVVIIQKESRAVV